eukprot:gb/GFBE01036205.1/.p1 GENE.gb/GFBE01036205.1/~~gb/GFBE01036205.1/.p1  ORF type:complete len:135 (+),score=17.84 gb/GFBE01036205.1/:1-405(+)
MRGNQDSDAFHYTEMCKFFQANRCTRGNTCTFAHHPFQLRAKKNLLRTKLCAEFERAGSCSFGANCTHAHGREELADTMGTSSTSEASEPTERQKTEADKTHPAAVEDVGHLGPISSWPGFVRQLEQDVFIFRF